MAYVANTATAEDEDKKQAINISEGAGGIAAEGGARAGMPGDGSQAGPEPVMFKDYLDANQEGSAQLGETVKAGVNASTEAAKGAITAGQQGFNTAADAGKVNWNQAALDNTLNTGQANDDFNRLISGTYSGPATWEQAGVAAPASTAVNRATQTGQLTDTNSGRKQLLQEYITRTLANTTGNLGLNSGLLSGREDVVDGVKGAGTGAKGTAGELSAARDQATQRVNEITANNQAMRDNALGGVRNYLGEADKTAAQRLAEFQQWQQQTDNAARDSLSRGQLPTDWSTMGISQGQADELMNQIRYAQQLGLTPDLSQFYTQGTASTSQLSAEDAARFNALSQIAGTGGKYTAGGGEGAGKLNAQAALADLQNRIAQQRAANEAKAAEEARARAAAEAAARAVAPPPPPPVNPYLAQYLQMLGIGQENVSGSAGGSGGVGEGASPPGASTDGTGPSGIGAVGSPGAVGSGIGAAAGMAGMSTPPGLGMAASAVASLDQAISNANSGGPGSPGSAGNSGAAAGVGNGTAGSPGGNTGQEGNAANSDGNGGSSGGSGGSCVMATALVSTGQWAPTAKNSLVEWCEKTLHNTYIGETLRRGYQVLGAKLAVPNVRKENLRGKYFKWSFEQITNTLTGKRFNPLSLPNTLMWVGAAMLTGAVVSKKYATKTWKNLYKDNK